MQCNIGDYLTESGFKLYEKLHIPIILINKNGRILNLNRAGKKLLAVADTKMTEAFIKNECSLFSTSKFKKTIVLKSRNKNIILSIQKISDYFLIEVRR